MVIDIMCGHLPEEHKEWTKMLTKMGLNIKPWCICISINNWHRQDGYVLDGPSGLWVHPRCRKPDKMNYDRMVLGLPQIPRPRDSDDIIKIEIRYAANRTVKTELTELGWLEDAEDWEPINDDD